MKTTLFQTSAWVVAAVGLVASGLSWCQAYPSGISMVHVPYNGGTPAVLNTMSGQVQLVITAIPTVLPQVKAPLAREGAETAVNGPTALAEFHRTEMAKWRKIIRASIVVLD